MTRAEEFEQLRPLLFSIAYRILGSVGKRGTRLHCLKLAGMRLHARVIIRDGRQAFLGSQSLRPPELDIRREIGLIVKNAAIVRALRAVFEKDWQGSAPREEAAPDTSRMTTAAEATA